MNTHQNNASVQEFGCRALAAMLINSECNGQCVRKEGGIVTIVTAMSIHTTVAAVQEAGCRALVNALKSDNEEIRGAVLAAGGQQAIKRAMHLHASPLMNQLGSSALELLPPS